MTVFRYKRQRIVLIKAGPTLSDIIVNPGRRADRCDGGLYFSLDLYEYIQV